MDSCTGTSVVVESLSLKMDTFSTHAKDMNHTCSVLTIP